MPEFFTVASHKLLQKDLKIGPFLDGLSLCVCAPTNHKTLAKMVTFRPIFGRKRSQKGAKLCGQLTSKTWHPNLVKTASHINT